jgi:hypothetical protein
MRIGKSKNKNKKKNLNKVIIPRDFNILKSIQREINLSTRSQKNNRNYNRKKDKIEYLAMWTSVIGR